MVPFTPSSLENKFLNVDTNVPNSDLSGLTSLESITGTHCNNSTVTPSIEVN
jgi:hypothetical protein